MTAFKPEKCPNLVPDRRIIIHPDMSETELLHHAGHKDALLDVSGLSNLSLLPPIIQGGVYSTQENINLQRVRFCHTVALPNALSVEAPFLESALLLYTGTARDVLLPSFVQGVKIVSRKAIEFSADRLRRVTAMRLDALGELRLPGLESVEVLTAGNLRRCALPVGAVIGNFKLENFPYLEKIEMLAPPPPPPVKEPGRHRLVRVPRPKPD